MSDSTAQEDVQPEEEIKSEEAQGKSIGIRKKIMAKLHFKLPSFPSLKNSKAIMLAQQYVLPMLIIFVLIGVITFLFFMQRERMYEDKDNIMERMKEEGLVEIEEKLVEQKVGTARFPQEGVSGKAAYSGQGNVAPSVADRVSSTMPIDNATYVIEANRFYEQGDYESASTFYEKGMDRLMSFVNEDFVVFRLGDCYLKLDRYNDALDTFRSLVNDYIESPYQLKCKLKMGECYAGLGKYREARNTLYSVVAQEGKAESEDDKSAVVESYFKIGDYYMEEAKKLRNVNDVVGTTSVSNKIATN